MTLSWQPVIWVDILGSATVLVIAVWCARLAWQWKQGKKGDTFRHYVFLLTAAIVFFAVSRSVGHLLKNVCSFIDQGELWAVVAPFSGAVNTATFVIIFAFGLYFHRQRVIHEQLENYKNNLELLVFSRTRELESANTALENEIIERMKVEEKRLELIDELREALDQVKVLSGFLPICSSCKKIRDDKGYWNQIEEYIREHSEAEFTHGICPDCKEKLYGHMFNKVGGGKKGK